MIKTLIALTITADGILSILFANTYNPDEKHHTLLNIGRTIRTTLGIILAIL